MKESPDMDAFAAWFLIVGFTVLLLLLVWANS